MNIVKTIWKIATLAMLLVLTSVIYKLDDHGHCATCVIGENNMNVHENSTKHTNLLANEKSPYLLQHAGNPVDWYPWGDEAFEKARQEDKPIFLSIGYSTCHWCHVMAHESFEDEQTAKLINEVFIPVKVDREERPDVDMIYMTVCQMMTGGGGWPLTIIMTPDKEPFFAGTYIPRENNYGRIGLKELTKRVGKMWKENRAEVMQSADKIRQALTLSQVGRPGKEVGEHTLKAGFDQLSGMFDQIHGGFGAKPKFPTPHNLMFLLRYWDRTGDSLALEMVERSLEAMRLGGIFDHVGFGFHRYSTDPKWLLPHFEKMLYDQALLTMAYTEGYLATKNQKFKAVAQEILEYVLSELLDPVGGFHSAEDADSEGVEGKFYVWTIKQVEELLGKEDAALWNRVYNVHEDGNFVEEVGSHKTGNNIFHLRQPLEEIAKTIEMNPEELAIKLEAIRIKLFEAREKRIHPHKDDKILTDWNGLMIAALAKAARAFDEPVYSHAANNALQFILNNMVDEKGNLLHRYRDGEAKAKGNLNDYAFLIWGLLELYEADFNIEHLKRAIKLTDDAIKRFHSKTGGAFFFTAEDAEKLLVRPKEIYDGAVPSGNSVMALNLGRLARITADNKYQEKADEILKVYSGEIERAPAGHTQLLCALDFLIGPSYEIVIAGQREDEKTLEMIHSLRHQYIPNKITLLKDNIGEDALADIAPYTLHQPSLDKKATAYVCRNFQCKLPVTDPDGIVKLIGKESGQEVLH